MTTMWALKVPAPAPPLYCTPDVMRAAEASARQVDHWRVSGYVRPLCDSTGSGVKVRWSPLNVARVAVIVAVAELAPMALHTVAPRLSEAVAAHWPMVPRRLYVTGDGTVTAKRPNGTHLAVPAAAVAAAALKRLEAL